MEHVCCPTRNAPGTEPPLIRRDMAIRFICPQGHQLTVPEERAGMRGTCPRCKCRVVVPMQDDVPANVSLSKDRSAWEEAQFEDKAKTKGDSGVAIPVDDDVAMAELAEPMSPADFAAKNKPASKSTLREAPTDQLLEPLSPADFAKGTAPADLPPVQPPAAQPSAAKVDPPVAVHESRDGRGFRLDAGNLRGVYIWALVEVAITLLMALPALEHLGLSGAPLWAWVVLLLVLLQSAYAMWVVALPDWSTVWFGSLMFGLTSATHLTALVLSVILPQGNFLGLPSGSWATPVWCTLVTIVTAAMAYGCVRISRPWRVAYEAYKAGLDASDEGLVESPVLQ